jgi:hypothetical protein
MHSSILRGRRTRPDTERADVGDASDELLSNGSRDKSE